MDVITLRPSTDIRVQRDSSLFFEHVKHVAARLTQRFAEYGIPIRVRCREDDDAQFDRLIDDPMHGRAIEQFVIAKRAGKNLSGMLHDTQIDTFAEIVHNIYHDPGKNILVLGAMMCGKTGTANATHLLGPLAYLLNGRKYYPIQLLPVRRASHRQTSNEARLFEALYQDLTFERRDGTVVNLAAPNGITLRRYRARVLRDKLHAHARALASRTTTEVFELVVRSRTRRNLDPIRKLCQAAYDDGFAVVIIIDEPHWGSHKSGIQDRMIATLGDAMQDISKEHILLTLDATPFEISNAGKFSIVRHRLGENYCGPNCWGGEPLDPSVKTKDILLEDLDSFAKKLGFKEFAWLNRKAYESAAGFEKWRTKWNKGKSQDKRVEGTHRHYQRCVEAALKGVIEKLLLHSPNGRTRGLCLRLLKSNALTAKMVERLSLDKRIKVIHYMENRGQDTVEEAIDEAAPTEPYIVVVTGAARMADYFPQHCTHFIDLTDTISNQTSLMQGSYGRACSHGEPRTVAMTAKNIGFIRRYVETMGAFMINPGPQVVGPSDKRRGAPMINVRIYKLEAEKFPLIRAAFNRLQTEVIDLIPYNGGKLQSIKVALPHIYEDGYVPYWKFFSERHLSYMEKEWRQFFPGCGEPPRILRPGVGQRLKNGKFITTAMHPTRPLSDGYGKIGVRNLTNYEKRYKPSENMREKGKHFYTKTENTARDEISGGTQPQVWLVKHKTRKRWEISSIVLRLERPVRGRRVELDEILPTERNMYFDYLNDAQQHEVRERRRMRDNRAKARRGFQPRA